MLFTYDHATLNGALWHIHNWTALQFGEVIFCRGLCQSIREFKMATQVTGRKRIPNREKLSAEDDALSQIAREVRFHVLP